MCVCLLCVVRVRVFVGCECVCVCVCMCLLFVRVFRVGLWTGGVMISLLYQYGKIKLQNPAKEKYKDKKTNMYQQVKHIHNIQKSKVLLGLGSYISVASRRMLILA